MELNKIDKALLKTIADLHDGMLLKDMDKAIEVLKDREEGEEENEESSERKQ